MGKNDAILAVGILAAAYLMKPSTAEAETSKGGSATPFSLDLSGFASGLGGGGSLIPEGLNIDTSSYEGIVESITGEFQKALDLQGKSSNTIIDQLLSALKDATAQIGAGDLVDTIKGGGDKTTSDDPMTAIFDAVGRHATKPGEIWYNPNYFTQAEKNWGGKNPAITEAIEAMRESNRRYGFSNEPTGGSPLSVAGFLENWFPNANETSFKSFVDEALSKIPEGGIPEAWFNKDTNKVSIPGVNQLFDLGTLTGAGAKTAFNLGTGDKSGAVGSFLDFLGFDINLPSGEDVQTAARQTTNIALRNVTGHTIAGTASKVPVLAEVTRVTSLAGQAGKTVGTKAVLQPAGKKIAGEVGEKVAEKVGSRIIPGLGWGLTVVDVGADFSRLLGFNPPDQLGFYPIFKTLFGANQDSPTEIIGGQIPVNEAYGNLITNAQLQNLVPATPKGAGNTEETNSGTHTESPGDWSAVIEDWQAVADAKAGNVAVA